MTLNPKQSTFPWVLITGGSHGIGRALALECIRRKMAVVIVALPDENLEAITAELDALAGSVFTTLGIDLLRPEAPREVVRWLAHAGIQPTYLVNNAGFGRGGLFEHTPWAEYRAMMQLNNQVMVELTYALLPVLKRTRGGVLNMSSVESSLPLPYKTVYTGTKAFVLNYSLALRQEFRYYDISVTALCPGPVITNADGLKRVKAMGRLARMTVTMPEDLAGEAIDGMLKGKDVVHPGVQVPFFAFLGWLVPRRLKMRLLERLFAKYRVETPALLEPTAVLEEAN